MLPRYDESNSYLEVGVCFHRNYFLFHSYSCKTYPNIRMKEKWNEIPFPTLYSLVPNALLSQYNRQLSNLKVLK